MDGALGNISSMKVAELKKELKSRGLSVTGNKNELIERLQLAVMPEEIAEEDDSALLEEADDILAEEPEPEPEQKQEKKVAIKRDSALPIAPAAAPAVQDTPTEEQKTEEKVEDTPKKIEAPKDPETTPTGKRRITAPLEGSSTSTKITVLGGEKPEAVVEADGDNDDKADKAESTVKAPMTDAERAAARAARFGVTTPAAVDDKKSVRAARFGVKIGESPKVDLDTLKKRAERFGQSSSNTLKRLELAEQIKKRQDRFGEAGDSEKSKMSTNQNLLVDEKLQKRAERFGTEVKA